MPGVNLVSRHSKKAKQTNKNPHKAFSVLVEPYNIASPSYTTWRATDSRQHHDRSSGIHLGHLWRLQISCEFLACVIAQQRVQPIVGNPLTEHYQLFVRAYVRADQQVLSLKRKRKEKKEIWMEVAVTATPVWGETRPLRTLIPRMRGHAWNARGHRQVQVKFELNNFCVSFP